ncbi:substrate-binding domain-containing protein [Cohnella sp. CFH 77786]|uniref:sugar ABC transporter substrate-binding protein n=1 Tax=Cohnella sp. CFH 77786 TaxID=2662265 RepID=UPI001C610B1B|nr:substrate-binding domain-containing protein [Cohnella sp. CFH 77786]MBW5445419.1 substrate-binding domain-containing protein [Cohnella sp. CFH 77786]
MRQAGKYRKWTRLPLAAGLLAALAGCTGAAGETPVSSSPAGGASAAPYSYTFGIIYPMAHPYYETMTETAQKAAEPAGVRLVVKAPDEANLEQQIRMMETMIKMGVDAIAIDPVDSDALAPVIDKAVLGGIPVICFESDAPSSKRLGFVGVDNVEAGVRMGQAIDRQLKGRGMVLVETGMSRMRSLGQRLQGMLDYINAHTDIQVLEVRYNEGSEDKALSDLEEMIDAHPHFDAFIALDVVSGPASVLVWKAKGLTRYAVTFGVTPKIREAIANGQIKAAVSQNEAGIGTRIVERMLQAAQGQAVPAFDDTGLTEIASGSAP